MQPKECYRPPWNISEDKSELIKVGDIFELSAS